MRPGLRTLLLAALAFTLSGCATGPAHPGGASAEIFNGRDLTGWNGDPRFWRVEGGAIVGQTTPENALSQNTFIVWEAGTIEDFTLRLQFRVTGGNSGVQYRSRVLGGWSVAGYQADMDAENRYTGMLYDEQGRGIIALRGQKVVIEPDGRFNVVGTVGDTAALRRSIDMSGWNTLEASMIGNHIVHRINGRVTVDVTDNQAEEREDSGILALQIHTGGPMKVEFRDIRLTRLARGAMR